VDATSWNARSDGYLPGLLGVEIVTIGPGRVESALPIRRDLLAPNGFLHAATVIGLADTSAGYGCVASLPEGASGFTTVEVKANFLGTLREGRLACVATLIHGGRSTQVWDARVADAATDRAIALFRCTQLILYPR
jgi:uncharacterized protein (TIGR00369 family)